MREFDAALCAKRIRKLHRNGLLSHAEFAVAETLLWSCRGKAGDRASVSFTRIASLAHVARVTAVKAIAALCSLGVLRKEKRRVFVPWLGGLASRQATNLYVFLAASTGFSEDAVYRRQEEKKECQEGKKAVWRGRDRPLWPVRSVAEQLAILVAAA